MVCAVVAGVTTCCLFLSNPVSVLRTFALLSLIYVPNTACVRGSPMVPLVGNICIIGTNLITNGTISKEIGTNGKNGNAIGTSGTNVTNQWYHWENPEHTHDLVAILTTFHL